MKIPSYIRVSQEGSIYVDWEMFKKSSEHKRELKKTQELVRYLKNERKHKKTSNRSCF